MQVENGVLIRVENEDINLLNSNPDLFWKGITSIGTSAFYNCENLKEINIPNAVTSIGNSAFYNCQNLTNVTIPNSVKDLGKGAFSYCKNLKEIIIPNTVTSIGNSAFSNCQNLREITLPNSLAEISPHTFSWCENLKEINIPNTVTSIGTSAFYNCQNLTSIKIPNSVIGIGTEAFSHCRNLREITLPNSLAEISTHTFSWCENITDIAIPNTITRIGEYAFYNCKSLENIKLPNSLESIGIFVFSGCDNLREIILPDSITRCGFHLYSGIKSIICNDKTLNLHSEFLRSIVQQKRLKNLFENIPQKQINNVINLFRDESPAGNNLDDYTNLCSALGAFENSDKTMKWNGNDVAVKDIAYTFLQGAKNREQLNFEEMHMNFQALKPQGFNEEFLKFCLDKNNWNDIFQEPELLPTIYEWYLGREKLDLQENLSDEELPHTEENRYRLLTFKTMENGVDKMKWLSPTVELFKEEFLNKKFTGITTTRDKEIANEIALHTIYEQKHFDKAKEIDEERQKLGVTNVIKKPVVQGRIASLEEYKEKTKAINDHIVETSKEILAQEKEDTSHIFTYESLDKSDPVNFAIGCYTSCCAQLYGAGAGAMRAMIIHPDIQPLAIRDFNGKIVSFGIIYVNREEGYAVVNDFEVNHSYDGKDSQRKAIYDKAMEGVKAFIDQYNKENPKRPIKKVTCGCSPNWTAINDFIRNNPESEILKAPNFDDFKYAGSGSWSGDWHRNQYLLWEEDENEISR